MPITEEYWALVHKSIPMNQAMKIKNAKAAVDAEWTKLEQKNSWNLLSVRPRKEVIAEAKAAGKHVHFGRLMDLRHEKFAERQLPESEKVY